MKCEANNKRIHSVVVFFLFLIISYGVTSYSSTLTHTTVCGNLDSYCYRYMGMVIAKGGIPYRDAFDNKGPLIYLLNCLGYLISKKYGVFIIEYVFMLIYLAVNYAIARRFTDSKRALIYTFVALGPIGAFYIGNMTEEYALVFISIGLLIFVDYFLFDKKDWYRIVICGLACGAVLMLRPNMIALWGVFCVYSVVVSIKQDKRFPMKTFLFFLSGVLIFTIPFLIWLGINGAIEEFFNDYILTNIYYSNEFNSSLNICKSFISYMLGSISEVYIFLLFFLVAKKEKIGFNITFILYMILNILVMSLSGKGFEHYGMVTLPALVYPLSASSKTIKKSIKKPYLFDVLALLTSVMLMGFIINMYMTTIPALISGYLEETRNEKILSIISDNTQPDDRILVLGFKDFYYVESERLASSKFHFFTSMNANYPGGLTEVSKDINSIQPKIVIVEMSDYQYLNFDFSDYILLDEELNVWIHDE